jgi:hypothetical protein
MHDEARIASGVSGVEREGEPVHGQAVSAPEPRALTGFGVTTDIY